MGKCIMCGEKLMDGRCRLCEQWEINKALEARLFQAEADLKDSETACGYILHDFNEQKARLSQLMDVAEKDRRRE